MTVNGSEDHSISLSDASKMTKNYRNTIKTGEILGGYFGKDAIVKTLNQDGCVGIRYYYALNDSGEKNLVLVGVDENGNDLENGILSDASTPCPPFCAKSNPLNSN